MMMWILLLISVAAASPTCGSDNLADTHTLLQVQHLVRGKKGLSRQTSEDTADALLSKVKSMVLALKENQENPIRQCQGGWQDGDGSGGSEQSVGTVANQTICIATVRVQCPQSNAATFVDETGSCFCKIGQESLNSSVTGKRNCAFFGNLTDSSLDDASNALEELVKTMLQAMAQEHDSATRLNNVSWNDVATAFAVINDTHSAAKVRDLQATNISKADAYKECMESLAEWSAKKQDACLNGFDYSGCDTATQYLTELTASCPEKEAEYAQAHALYVVSASQHTDGCTNFETVAKNRESEAAEMALSLEQRNREYCVLQQVQCFLRLIRNATQNGTMLQGDPILACSGSLSTDPQDSSASEYTTPSAYVDAACGAHHSYIASEAGCRQFAQDEGLSYSSNWPTSNGWNHRYYVSGCQVSSPYTAESRRRRATVYWQPHYDGYSGRRRNSAIASYAVCKSTSDLIGCGGHFNMSFPPVPATECVQGLHAEIGEPVAFDYADSICSASAPVWKGGKKCSTSRKVLRWNDWFQSKGKNGYWQVVTKNPEVFIKFSLSVSRGPAFAIKYSDDGVTWSTAATVSSATHNSGVEWSPTVGGHRYWRYEITGDWASGGWYKNLQFFNPQSRSTKLERSHFRYANPSVGSNAYCISMLSSPGSNAGCNASACQGHQTSDARLQRCDTSDGAQMFYHNYSSNQFRSSLGTNRCLSVSGSTSNCAPLTLQECSVGEERQQFHPQEYGGSNSWYSPTRRRIGRRYINSNNYYGGVNGWVQVCGGTPSHDRKFEMNLESLE